jgi:hypothetical protein
MVIVKVPREPELLDPWKAAWKVSLALDIMNEELK